MADEGLEVGWCCGLCLIVPNLDEIVFATGKHEATVVR